MDSPERAADIQACQPVVERRPCIGMDLFYTRHDDPTGSTVAVYSWPYLLSTFLILGAALTNDLWDGDSRLTGPTAILINAGMALLLIQFFATRRIRRDIRKAMAKGSVRVTGSTWDPRRPITYSFGGEDRAEGSLAIDTTEGTGSGT